MKRIQDRWKCISQTSLQILIYTFLLLLSPLILLILLILTTYKYGILRLIVKYFKPKLLQGLNPTETFYASDQFWGDSRSSSALILVLDGNVSLEQIRQDFLKQVVLATDHGSLLDPPDRLFPRLMQIPVNYGGYYFWQKASYFLIHEHIRPIQTRIDEGGLKKFAGTVLTLPYPNKRPLWEILVFPSYDKQGKEEIIQEMQDNFKKEQENVEIENDEEILPPPKSVPKSKCSALVIRMHAAIGDPDDMIKMISLLCNRNTFSLQSLKLPDCVSDTTAINAGSLSSTVRKCDNVHQPSQDIVTRIRNLLKMPKNIHVFLSSFFQPCSASQNLIYSSEGNNPTTVSWGGLNKSQISKIVQSQAIDRSGLLLSLILGALRNGLIPNLQIQHSSPEQETDLEEMNNGENKPKNDVNLPILCSIRSSSRCGGHLDAESVNGFTFLKNCGGGDHNHGTTLSESETLNQLSEISDQLVSAINEANQPWISNNWLKLLSLFPHPVVKCANFHLKGATLIFQEGKTDLSQLLRETRKKHSLSFGRRISLTELPENDLIFIGDHQLLDVVPVCGLMFRRSAIAASVLKFQNSLKISITINSSLMPELGTMPSSRCSSSIRSNQIIMDKQMRADQIANDFLGQELDKILQDAKDDHGFVRIPIN